VGMGEARFQTGPKPSPIPSGEALLSKSRSNSLGGISKITQGGQKTVERCFAPRSVVEHGEYLVIPPVTILGQIRRADEQPHLVGPDEK